MRVEWSGSWARMTVLNKCIPLCFSFLKKGILTIPFYMISKILIMMFVNADMIMLNVKMMYMRRMDVAISRLIISQRFPNGPPTFSQVA